MSDWRLTANSSVYKEALQATESLGQPALGFVKQSETTPKLATSKQLNTLLQLVVKIKEDLKLAVKRLEAAKGKEVATPESLTGSIEDQQKQLQGLKIGSSSEPKVPKAQGKFFVFKNPRDIFNAEKQIQKSQ